MIIFTYWVVSADKESLQVMLFRPNRSGLHLLGANVDPLLARLIKLLNLN